jgi:murein DD-endopeptidase MepM/ murein hydrolase activator NlpD
MTCHQTRRLLSVRREWTAQERARAGAHLNGCPACQAVAREYELIDRRLDRLPQPALVAASPAAVQARLIIEEQPVKSQPVAWRRQAALGLALVVFVILAAITTPVWQEQLFFPIQELAVAPAASLGATAVTTAPQPPPEIAYPQIAQVGENLLFLGYDLQSEQVRPGESLHLTLYWQVLAQADISYTVFVHVLDKDSRLWAQRDAMPGNGSRPTTSWLPGEIFAGEFEVPLNANALPGTYDLAVGVYETSTGRRLPVSNEAGEPLGDLIPLRLLHIELSEIGKEAESNGFLWPVAGTLTQTYWEGHTAVDVACRTGTPVYAAVDGVVAQVGRDEEHGNFILLDHNDGYETFYSHLNAVDVEDGTQVKQGQKIGEVGSTGVSTGPHLHFEIRKGGEHLNPLAVVPEEARADKLISSLTPEDGVDQPHLESPKFSWPTEGHVTQTYWSGHQALDIASKTGTPIHAAAAGTVKLADEDTNRHGIHIELEHKNGYTTFYSHLSASHVEVGEHVEAGQEIGLVGSTGMSTGPHLHFEIRDNGKPVNPLELLP